MVNNFVEVNECDCVYLPVGSEDYTSFLTGCDVVLAMSKDQGVFSHHWPGKLERHIKSHKGERSRQKLGKKDLFNDLVVFSMEREFDEHFSISSQDFKKSLDEVYGGDLNVSQIFYPPVDDLDYSTRFICVDVVDRSFSSWFNPSGKL